MKKPKKRAAKSAQANPASSDKRDVNKTAFNELTVAAWEGVGDFLRINPFDVVGVKGREAAILERMTEELPSVIHWLLLGILLREGGFRPPKYPPKPGGNRKGKKQKDFAEQELAKIEQRYDLEPLSKIGTTDESLYRKRILSKIHGELSPEEQACVIWKDAEEAIIERISLHRWTDNLQFIVHHAALGNKRFFERLGLALYYGHSPSYSPTQAFLLLNWEELRNVQYRDKFPGLKFWRDDAVRSYLTAMFYNEEGQDLTIEAYRSQRDRLGLRPEKKKTVKSCVWLPEAKRFSIH